MFSLKRLTVFYIIFTTTEGKKKKSQLFCKLRNFTESLQDSIFLIFGILGVLAWLHGFCNLKLLKVAFVTAN